MTLHVERTEILRFLRYDNITCETCEEKSAIYEFNHNLIKASFIDKISSCMKESSIESDDVSLKKK